MVQGEKSNMLATSSCMARTADPFARKAGFEAVQRMDSQASKKTTAPVQKDTSSASSSKSSNNYGSWGPVFQDKQNFASMHWC